MEQTGRTWLSTWGRGSLSITNRDQKVETPKALTLVDPGSGEQPISWQKRTLCNTCCKFHLGQCRFDPVHCYECGEAGRRVSNCPKAEWNRGKNVQGARLRNPQPAAPQG